MVNAGAMGVAGTVPPPRAVPWMAATTGTSLASMAPSTAGSQGSAGGLPNSLMSAPAKKVRPAQ